MKNLAAYFILVFVLYSCSNDDSQSQPDAQVSFNNELEIVKTYGGTEEDDALSVVETADGNIAVLGFTQSINGDVSGKETSDSDYWLMKLDKDLNMIWNKVLGGSSDDRGQSIIATQEGGFLLSGFSRSSDGDVSENFGFHDYWVLKLDASGNIIWEKTFGFAGNDRSYSAIQTNDGGYFITGFLDVSASGGEGNDNGTAGRPKNILHKHGVGEFWGVKLNADGSMQWRRYFGGSNNDRSYDVIQAHDGNIIMVGSSESNDFDITSPQGSYDFWAVKVNLNGDLIWQKNFGGSGIDIGYSIEKSLNNTYYLAGDTRSDDVQDFKGVTDSWVINLDENANSIWKKTYGGNDFETARSIIQLQSGDLFITGSSKSNDIQVSENYGGNDVWLVNTDSSGNIISTSVIGGSEFDFANQAVQLSTGEVIIVGSSQSSDYLITENRGNKDALIIKMK